MFAVLANSLKLNLGLRMCCLGLLVERKIIP